MDDASLLTEDRWVNSTESQPPPGISWHASVPVVPLSRGWDAEACAIDWSGAGEADLLVTSRGGPKRRTTWLYRAVTPREPGKAPCYDQGREVAGLEGLRSICPVRAEEPARFGLLALGDGGLVYLPNLGSSGEPLFSRRTELGLGPDLGIPNARVIQMTAVDWDQDGLIDLLIGCHDLTGYWPGDGRIPSHQLVGLNQDAAHPAYDRRGLWRGSAPAGRIFWLRNVGDGGEPRFELQPEIQGESGPLDIGLHPAPLAVAWGGRGSTELLLSDDRGLLRVYRNFGGQLPPVLMEPRTLQCGGAPLQLTPDRISLTVADLDGDRRPELLYGTSTGHLFAVHCGSTRNEAKTPTPIFQKAGDVRLGGHAAFVARDLDGDGDLDLLWGDGFGRVHFAEDLGSGDDHQYGLPVTLEAGGAPFRIEPGPDGRLYGPDDLERGFARPALGDWLEHGRLDLIVTGAGGDVLLLPNDGALTQPRFGHPQRLGLEGEALILPPRVQPAIAYWTNPGGLDLIGLDLQGFLCAYPQIERNEVGPPVPILDHLGRLIRLDASFGLAGRCSIWAGPWTAPDRVDLLIGLPRTNRHVVSAVTGTPLEDLDALATVLLLENRGPDGVIPRMLRFKDGTPVIAGFDGCCPQGVPRAGKDLPDLLLLSDDGSLRWIVREALCW